MNYYKCDNFSEFSDTKLNNLYDIIIDTDLKCRYDLSMNKKQKFGTEIEFAVPFNSSLITIKNKFKNNPDGWILKKETTASENFAYEAGLELVSPKLNNSKIKLIELEKMFNYLYENGAKINLHCSNHVHFDIKILKNKYKYYERFLKFFTVYEPIIYMFGCGEIDYMRKRIFDYAREIGSDYVITNNDDRYRKINRLQAKYSCKDRAIRFSEFNTIEIRTAFGTLNPAINQNNILFFYKIFEYVTSKRYNEDLINKKFELAKTRKTILNLYQNLDKDEVLELCDLLYDNNLDKMYFLKQCLKLYNKNDYKYTSNRFLKSKKLIV